MGDGRWTQQLLSWRWRSRRRAPAIATSPPPPRRDRNAHRPTLLPLAPAPRHRVPLTRRPRGLGKLPISTRHRPHTSLISAHATTSCRSARTKYRARLTSAVSNDPAHRHSSNAPAHPQATIDASAQHMLEHAAGAPHINPTTRIIFPQRRDAAAGRNATSSNSSSNEDHRDTHRQMRRTPHTQANMQTLLGVVGPTYPMAPARWFDPATPAGGPWSMIRRQAMTTAAAGLAH
jgi:hypothetical protein